MTETGPHPDAAPVEPAGPALATRHVLSLDLGTSSVKAAVVSESGAVVAAAARPTTLHLLPGGGAEQDPEEWWTGACAAAREALAAADLPPANIVAVALTAQWSVVVPVGADGAPLARAVHWMDVRGGPYNRAITKGFPSVQGYGLLKLRRWITLTGLAPTHSGVDALGHVLFLKHERPEVYAQAEVFLEPTDYLALKLTGRVVASQHTMIPFLLVDNRTLGSTEYCDPLLALAGVDRDKLPELVANDDLVGPVRPAVAADLGLAPGTPVLIGVNDTNAAVIGAGAVPDYRGVISMGTSLVLTCHLPFKKTDLVHMMTTMPSPLAASYLLMAEQGTGAKSLEHFLKTVVYAEDELATGPLPDDAYLRVNRCAATAPPGSDGALFLPWLNGTLCPEENADARGGFVNLSLKTTRAHLSRAVLEGLAYNSRWTRQYAERFCGRPFERFRLVGGGALSDLWCQIHADVLGVPIERVAEPTRCTVRGAAFLALNKLGVRPLAELSDLVPVEQTFEPDPRHAAIYDRLYAQFRQAYRRSRKIWAALNANREETSP